MHSTTHEKAADVALALAMNTLLSEAMDRITAAIDDAVTDVKNGFDPAECENLLLCEVDTEMSRLFDRSDEAYQVIVSAVVLEFRRKTIAYC